MVIAAGFQNTYLQVSTELKLVESERHKKVIKRDSSREIETSLQISIVSKRLLCCHSVKILYDNFRLEKKKKSCACLNFW